MFKKYYDYICAMKLGDPLPVNDIGRILFDSNSFEWNYLDDFQKLILLKVLVHRGYFLENLLPKYAMTNENIKEFIFSESVIQSLGYYLDKFLSGAFNGYDLNFVTNKVKDQKNDFFVILQDHNNSWDDVVFWINSESERSFWELIKTKENKRPQRALELFKIGNPQQDVINLDELKDPKYLMYFNKMETLPVDKALRRENYRVFLERYERDLFYEYKLEQDNIDQLVKDEDKFQELNIEEKLSLLIFSVEHVVDELNYDEDFEPTVADVISSNDNN